jgi:ubiquinone/menaquinone biosynthesis C-methylase UbiE
MRAELICQAAGVVVEVGAGTGHNLAHYTDSVTQLILTEPDPHMARRLRARLEAAPPAAQAARVVAAPAERLPVADGSIDVVVATLVLCTVSDPAAAVAEIERILRPAGRLFLIEHVRSPDPRLARWQDRLERPWGWLAGGCHPNRDTASLIAASGFEPVRIDSGDYPRIMAPLTRPMIRGVARAPAA